MSSLTSHDIQVMLLMLGVLLLCARVLGEVARRLNQPSVLGEIFAGILLGPTVLGALAPGAHAFLFPQTGGVAFVLHGITTLGIVLFLLVAGMEVDLSTIWRQGRAAISVGVAGIVIPFSVGFLAASIAPRFMGRDDASDPGLFGLFMGTVLSISALPIIAKALMDLNIYRSDLGMLVIAAAVFNDLVGWLMFALLLGMMDTPSVHGMSVGLTIALTLLFTAVMLTLVRWVFHRCLPWVQAHLSWPGGVLGLALSAALLAAAVTEWIGVHAIFGSFLLGVALGDSQHMREQTRATINQFVSFIFAPLFFASIGLTVNFVANFDLTLTVVVLLVATLGKVLGCAWGGHLGGLPRHESWAVGFAMNARGAMEIILGLLALQNGLIGERMFVSLVVMALVTSMIAGPAMQTLLNLKRRPQLGDFIAPRALLNPLHAPDAPRAIEQLVRAMPLPAGIDLLAATAAVLERENLMSTGIGDGLAVPHARIDGLTKPIVGLGLSREGVDFDAPDGKPAQLVFLILTPRDDDGAQVSILADIARRFRIEGMRQRALSVQNYTEFLALLKTTPAE